MLLELQLFKDLYDALAELLVNKENRKGKTPPYLSVLNDVMKEQQLSYDTYLIKSEALIDLCHESIMCYHFKDVPYCWRRLLMDAGLLKTLIQLHSFSFYSGTEDPQTFVQSMIADLDTVAIVSGAPGNNRRWVTNLVLEHLQSWLTNHRKEGSQHHLSKLMPLKKSAPLPIIERPIRELAEPPSFEWFLQHCDQDIPTPFIIPKGLIDHWPAFHQQHAWRSLDYLLSIAADRMVPVEIGSQYTDANWSQKMMRFSDFVEHHIVQQTEPTAYLAQHDLLHQIPQLERDIDIPDYCYIKPKLNALYQAHPDDVIKNAWFGPKNTVSPLHHDPYHNLLCQVVGSKYIKLISPQQSNLVYPRDGVMNNTSQVRKQKCNPDYALFPLFQKVDYIECVLKEGQVLYIPPKWWHYVQSLETSFSVSLWF
ncbi:hypothetical protein EDC96DRAFT_449182 [Choanephora cucurbitarum]|nr:hypothetical protein EDC96DRAFT_449182 [Choanephora cucurbitarum]